MARPKTEIDWIQVNQWLRAHCDGTAISSLLGIHPNTLYRLCEDKHGVSFSEYSQQKRGEGVMLMEESIYNDAISKGGADRIFWLKNKAGWKDKQEHEISGSINLHFDKDDAHA